MRVVHASDCFSAPKHFASRSCGLHPQWVNAWRDSGLSQTHFARDHALRVATLRRWIADESRQSSPTIDRPAFQEIDLASLLGHPSRTSASWEAEIRLPSGITLALAPGVPLSRVLELVEALRC